MLRSGLICWKLSVMRCLLFLLGTVVVCANAVEPKFVPQEIDGELEIGYGLALADVNGDGRNDILLADKRLIVWYENPSWTKHVIAEGLTEKDNVCIAARDINGDGKCEVAVGAEWNPGDTEGSGAVFYLMPPADRAQRWEPIRLSHEPTTHRMKWVRNRAGRFDLIVVPLHGRGNQAGVKVLAYHMPEDPRQPWNTSLVQGTMHATHNFEIIPAADGDAEELLLAGREGIVRLTQTDGGWHEHWITRHPADSETLKGAGEVRYGAFGGGQPYIAAIEPMHGNQLVLYTPLPRGPKDAEWSRRVLDDTLADGHALVCHDLLKQGNRQILVGWRSAQKIGPKVGVKMLVTTKEDGTGWMETLIDDNLMACEDLAVKDLDGDGDVDVVAAGRRTKNLKIYWNQSVRDGE